MSRNSPPPQAPAGKPSFPSPLRPSSTPRTSRPRVVIIAVGGPTCSGKTTLAKHLNQILPGSVILHQDDFAPAAEKVPMHPIYGVQDWDDKAGAIEWTRQRSTLRHVRETGSLPSHHDSHDHLNEQIPVPIAPSIQSEWKDKFQALEDGREGVETVYIIADGFLILCDEESVREFDVRLFVREEYEVLKRRREERHGYHTAVQSDPEGSLWRDPPEYWDQIVWPAYISAHAPLFVDGNVESGEPDDSEIEGVVLLEAGELSMDEIVRKACETVYERVKSGKGAGDWRKP